MLGATSNEKNVQKHQMNGRMFEFSHTYPLGPYMFPRSPNDRAKGASVDGGKRYGSSAPAIPKNGGS